MRTLFSNELTLPLPAVSMGKDTNVSISYHLLNRHLATIKYLCQICTPIQYHRYFSGDIPLPAPKIQYHY